MIRLIFTAVVVHLVALGAHAERPEAVRLALDYQMPAFDCQFKPPKQSADATTTELRRQKAIKKYQRCVRQYHAQLESDFVELRGTAQMGLTDDEAQIILTHLSRIQTQVKATTPRAASGTVELDRRDFYDSAHGS